LRHAYHGCGDQAGNPARNRDGVTLRLARDRGRCTAEDCRHSGRRKSSTARTLLNSKRSIMSRAGGNAACHEPERMPSWVGPRSVIVSAAKHYGRRSPPHGVKSALPLHSRSPANPHGKPATTPSLPALRLWGARSTRLFATDVLC
jgi:hypothetical protein